MLTEHKQTPLFKVTKLTQNTILPIIFTLKTIHPARSAINCDVYVGGKVRVSEFMIFFRFTTPWIKIKLCIISKTVVKLKSIINNKQ